MKPLSNAEKKVLLEAALYYLVDATTDGDYAGLPPGKKRDTLQSAIERLRE